MLFNSYQFIFFFLPITLLGFWVLSRYAENRIAISWMVLASLFYYGWWNPKYISLIIVSILINYFIAKKISQHAPCKWLFVLGVVINLTLLCYFKYANFFVNNFNSLTGAGLNLDKIVLPLAISFFTFQQIAYLTEAYRGKIKKYGFVHYCLFVTFFPQLIAGPIVQHQEMFPQFLKHSFKKMNSLNFSIGLSVFLIGLFKKAVLADGLAVYATPLFDAAAGGQILSVTDAWKAPLAYTLQLYFDFSGYADMAIGAASMFGIKLPTNFDSPYKSVNIGEFWRKWHVTLSRFLREYIYIPMGGNRYGDFRQQLNILITMLLAGLWHGAGWTFVIWGGLQGVYLVINNLWRLFRSNILNHNLTKSSQLGVRLAILMTTLSMVLSFVIFRADNMQTAFSIFSSMFGLNGAFDVPSGLNEITPWLVIMMLYAAIWILPNTQQLMAHYPAALDDASKNFSKDEKSWWQWTPTYGWGVIFSMLALFFICRATLGINPVSEFLYFQF